MPIFTRNLLIANVIYGEGATHILVHHELLDTNTAVFTSHSEGLQTVHSHICDLAALRCLDGVQAHSQILLGENLK